MSVLLYAFYIPLGHCREGMASFCVEYPAQRRRQRYALCLEGLLGLWCGLHQRSCQGVRLVRGHLFYFDRQSLSFLHTLYIGLVSLPYIFLFLHAYLLHNFR